MGKKLAEGVNVHLADSAGEIHSFTYGAEVPDWAMGKLGPHCFEGYDKERDGEGVAPDAAEAARLRDEVNKQVAESNAKIATAIARPDSGAGVPAVAPPEGLDNVPVDGEQPVDPGTPPAQPGTIPPLGGAGSGQGEWAAYATSLGLDPADKSRDEIVALVTSAGYPTSAS